MLYTNIRGVRKVPEPLKMFWMDWYKYQYYTKRIIIMDMVFVGDDNVSLRLEKGYRGAT